DSRSRARALTSPGFRLAPVMLVTTGPAVPRAAASSAVVVVFPLVPDTRYSATFPPMTAPPPRPVRRDTAPIPVTTALRAFTDAVRSIPGIVEPLSGKEGDGAGHLGTFRWRTATEVPMASEKQTQAARRNIKKAAAAAKNKRTLAHLPKKTKTALGKQAAAVRRRNRRGGTAPKTKTELYEIAKKRNLPGRSKMGRNELAEALGEE